MYVKSEKKIFSKRFRMEFVSKNLHIYCVVQHSALLISPEQNFGTKGTHFGLLKKP